jgi:hypothetical protein
MPLYNEDHGGLFFLGPVNIYSNKQSPFIAIRIPILDCHFVSNVYLVPIGFGDTDVSTLIVLLR